jgi:apolipoprotein N-acyltransferase
MMLWLPMVGSALLLTVIQPPISLSALAWVSLVPFVLVCTPDARPKTLAVAAYVVSLVYWLGNLYWVFPITIVGWAAYCLYQAVLWPILALCLRYCRTKKIPLFLAVPALFVGAERLQGFFLGGFFWRFLAHSQYANISVIQIADIFGAAGVSFLIAMVNGLLCEWLIIAAGSKWKWMAPPSPIRYGRMFIKTALVCCLLLGSLSYGLWRIRQSRKCVALGPRVAALQSNVPQSVKRTFQASDQLFNDLLKDSEAAVKAGAELVVWPETMVQATLNPQVLALLEASHPYRVFDRKLKDHARDNAFILVGAYGGTPKIDRDFNVVLDRRYNSAFLYRPDGAKADEKYDKIHLVPFGEAVPFRRSLPQLYDFLMKFTPYNYDYSLDYGSEYTAFPMTCNAPGFSPYRFGVMICYEDTVPYIARNLTLSATGKKRVDWLVNISNDGWFVRFSKEGKVLPSAELPQHVAVCVFRAVENRVAVVRSVNTGISCLIDSLGRVRDGFLVGTLPPEPMARKGMAGWFLDELPIDSRVTVFSRCGQWLDFSCATVLVSLIILPSLARFIGAKKNASHLSEKRNAEGRKKRKTEDQEHR